MYDCLFMKLCPTSVPTMELTSMLSPPNIRPWPSYSTLQTTLDKESKYAKCFLIENTRKLR